MYCTANQSYLEVQNRLKSVMQSDRNSYSGDVVLDSVNMAFSYEDNILDLIYEKQIFSDLDLQNIHIYKVIQQGTHVIGF